MRMTNSTTKLSKKLDPCLLYGLGLVYFHFNAFLLADRAFHDLLYLYPAFERANEVYLRLGIMAKISGDYDISLKHLNTALADVSSPCTFTRHEIKFHVAHVYEVRGDSHAKAKDLYEELLKETDISANLKADVFRQLGWMFHRFVLFMYLFFKIINFFQVCHYFIDFYNAKTKKTSKFID